MNVSTSDIQPWQPPAIVQDGRELDVWNAIISYSGRAVPFGDRDHTIEFGTAERPTATTPIIVIELEDGTRAGLVIRAFPFAEMFGVDIEISELPRLPFALRNCLEEGMVATLWSAIPERRMGDFRFLGTGALGEISGQTGADDWQWLDFTLAGATPVPAAATVGLPMSTLMRAVSDGALASVADGSMIADALTTEVSFTLGSLALTLNALATLQSGDIVALPQSSDDLLARVGWTSFSFRRTPEGWFCAARQAIERYRRDPDSIEGPSMTDVREDASASTDLGDLGIVLDFDLGRVTVPLSAVQSWQTGTIVALDPPASDTGVEVTIRANGQVIGNGDLVRIDERIAIRLTHLSLRK